MNEAVITDLIEQVERLDRINHTMYHADSTMVRMKWKGEFMKKKKKLIDALEGLKDE